MRKIHELSDAEYIDVVIASGEEDFKLWCEVHNIDYEDAMDYDWGD